MFVSILDVTIVLSMIAKYTLFVLLHFFLL